MKLRVTTIDVIALLFMIEYISSKSKANKTRRANPILTVDSPTVFIKNPPLLKMKPGAISTPLKIRTTLLCCLRNVNEFVK